MKMSKFWLVGICLLMTASPLFAQEREVGRYVVHLGVMSWETIQAGHHGEDSDLKARQYRMAKEMASMHGGGAKGDYHVLVVIDDRDSGRPIDDAEVRLEVSGAGGRRLSAMLERMDMAGFAGYGGYLMFNFAEPYTLRVIFSRPQDQEAREVEFTSPH